MHLIDVALVLTLLNLEAFTTAGRDKKEKPLRRVTHCPSVPYNIP